METLSSRGSIGGVGNGSRGGMRGGGGLGKGACGGRRGGGCNGGGGDGAIWICEVSDTSSSESTTAPNAALSAVRFAPRMSTAARPACSSAMASVNWIATLPPTTSSVTLVGLTSHSSAKPAATRVRLTELTSSARVIKPRSACTRREPGERGGSNGGADGGANGGTDGGGGDGGGDGGRGGEGGGGSKGGGGDSGGGVVGGGNCGGDGGGGWAGVGGGIDGGSSGDGGGCCGGGGIAGDGGGH